MGNLDKYVNFFSTAPWTCAGIVVSFLHSPWVKRPISVGPSVVPAAKLNPKEGAQV